MKKFLFSYWLTIALLFALFHWEFSPFSLLVNNIQTNFTSYLTSLSLPQGLMDTNKILISTSYSLVIEKACNGMIPYLFFLASIIAFPSTLLHKVKWAIMGYFFISLINVFRIWFITQLVLEEEENFSLAHDYLGNAILILTGLILLVSFIKTRTKGKKITPKTPQIAQVAL